MPWFLRGFSEELHITCVVHTMGVDLLTELSAMTPNHNMDELTYICVANRYQVAHIAV